MSSHQCELCQKAYKNKNSLQHHTRYVHCDEEQKKCEGCNKIFSSKTTLQRHAANCKEIERRVWVPSTLVNSNKNNERHEHNKVKISSTTEDMLQQFQSWLTSGGYSRKLLSYKRQLTGNSIKTYTYHLRSYLSYLDGDNDLILRSLEIRSIKLFLDYMVACEYQPKTIINRLFSIERWIGYVEDKMPLLGITRTSQITNRIDDCLSFIKAEVKILSPIATKHTQVRNCRESLEEDGKWIELSLVLERLEHKEREALLRMNEINNNINNEINDNNDHDDDNNNETNDNNDNDNHTRPLISDLNIIQDYILMHLIVYRPPMRSQNFILEILPKLQSPKKADRNGLCIVGSDIILQYCKYKTQEQYGYITFKLSRQQSELLISFINNVRKWFFPNPLSPTHQFLFCGSNGAPLLRIGRVVKKISMKWFDRNITIGTYRKIMESAVVECGLFNSQTRNSLSGAMLHDPATAKRYYISRDMNNESLIINNNWKLLIEHYTNKKNNNNNNNIVIEDINDNRDDNDDYDQ